MNPSASSVMIGNKYAICTVTANHSSRLKSHLHVVDTDCEIKSVTNINLHFVTCSKMFISFIVLAD